MALKTLASKFHFYQQVRLLLRKFRNGKIADATILNDKFRMVSTLSLEAPDGEVGSISQAKPEMPVELTLWYNGLTGAMGALPTSYSEWLIERHFRYGDSSAKAFIDLFGHRLYCLDYLVWQKQHLYAQAESLPHPPLQNVIQSLAGLLSTPACSSMRLHATWFMSPVRSMVNLERWLNQRYEVPVSITPFTGGWKTVSACECCQLSNPQHRLSRAPMIGRVRLEPDSHFDVTLGPASADIAHRFIHNNHTSHELWSCIRDYVGPVIDFSIDLIIHKTTPTPSPLGTGALGIDFWIGGHSSPHQYSLKLLAPLLNQDDTYDSSQQH